MEDKIAELTIKINVNTSEATKELEKSKKQLQEISELQIKPNISTSKE